MTLDVITVFKSADGRPVNKIVRRLPDGTITKSMARHSGRFRAHPVEVPNVQAMADLMNEVGKHADVCISLSLFVDPPAPEFGVVPLAELAAKLDLDPHTERAACTGWHAIDGDWITARIHENMIQGSWLLFDRDVFDDMPTNLAELTFDEWREAVDLLFPGFASCGYVMLPSTTSRVTVDGVPLASNSYHVYVKIDEPTDIGRAWSTATARALITKYRGVPLGFAKHKRSRAAGEVVATDWATIYDKSTATTGRLIFAGAPVAQDLKLAVLPPITGVH